MYMCVHKIMNMYIHGMYMVQTCMYRFAYLCGGGRIPDVQYIRVESWHLRLGINVTCIYSVSYTCLNHVYDSHSRWTTIGAVDNYRRGITVQVIIMGKGVWWRFMLNKEGKMSCHGIEPWNCTPVPAQISLARGDSKVQPLLMLHLV